MLRLREPSQSWALPELLQLTDSAAGAYSGRRWGAVSTYVANLGMRIYSDAQGLDAGADRLADALEKVNRIATRTAALGKLVTRDWTAAMKQTEAIVDKFAGATKDMTQSIDRMTAALTRTGAAARATGGAARSMTMMWTSGLLQMSQGWSRFTSTVTNGLRSIIYWSGAATTAIGGLAAYGVGKGLSYNIAMDTGRGQLGSILGAERGNAVAERVRRYAILTPYQTPQMMEPAKIAAFSGLPGDAGRWAELFGDLAAYKPGWTSDSLTQAARMGQYIMAGRPGNYGQALRLGRTFGIGSNTWEQFGATPNGRGSFTNTPNEMAAILQRIIETRYTPLRESLQTQIPAAFSTLGELGQFGVSMITRRAADRLQGSGGDIWRWIGKLDELTQSTAFGRFVDWFSKMTDSALNWVNAKFDRAADFFTSGKLEAAIKSMATSAKDFFGPTISGLLEAGKNFDWKAAGEAMASVTRTIMKLVEFLANHPRLASGLAVATIANQMGLVQMAAGAGRIGLGGLARIGGSSVGGAVGPMLGGGAGGMAGGAATGGLAYRLGRGWGSATHWGALVGGAAPRWGSGPIATDLTWGLRPTGIGTTERYLAGGVPRFGSAMRGFPWYRAGLSWLGAGALGLETASMHYRAEREDFSPWAGIGASALAGGQAGAIAGPWGALAGGGVGALAGTAGYWTGVNERLSDALKGAKIGAGEIQRAEALEAAWRSMGKADRYWDARYGADGRSAEAKRFAAWARSQWASDPEHGKYIDTAYTLFERGMAGQDRRYWMARESAKAGVPAEVRRTPAQVAASSRPSWGYSGGPSEIAAPGYGQAVTVNVYANSLDDINGAVEEGLTEAGVW